MLKEIILAIILGALLGFGLTGGYFALKTNKKDNNSPAVPTPIPLVSPSESDTNPQPTEKLNSQSLNSLTIDSPENESIVNNSKTTVSGKTSPRSIVIITTSQKTYTQNTKEDGLFSIDIDLESGANKINVSSIDTEDKQTDLQIIITYSTAKI